MSSRQNRFPEIIVKRPFESIATPDVVGVYDHVTVPTSGVDWLNWIVRLWVVTSRVWGDTVDDVTVGTAGVVIVSIRCVVSLAVFVALIVNADATKFVY